MSSAWLYLLGAINLAVGLYSLASSLRYLRYMKRSLSKENLEQAGEPPEVTLLVPCCGYEDGLEDNLRALFRQDYPRLQLVFIVENETDSSLPVVWKLLASEACPARLVVAGEAEDQGQKVHNLLAGLAQAQETEVFAFADSDCRPDPGWLSHLVAPLQRSEVGVTTGYRFYVPNPPSFASYLRSVWNAGVLTLLGDHDHNFAWGGSMAIRAETFRRAGVEQAWQRALSDDYALTHAVRRAGYRVEFVPRCLVASAGEISLGETLRWTSRQISITRVYWRNLWRIGGGTQILHCVFLLAGAAATLAGDVTAAVLLGAVLLAGCTSGGVRARAIFLLGRPWRERLQGHRWVYVWMTPLVGFVTAYGFIRSAFSSRIHWRGKTYEMRSPTETIIVREPASVRATGREMG